MKYFPRITAIAGILSLSALFAGCSTSDDKKKPKGPPQAKLPQKPSIENGQPPTPPEKP